MKRYSAPSLRRVDSEQAHLVANAFVARWALATELHAQHSVLWTSGQLADFETTFLPPDLLLASLRGRALTTNNSATIEGQHNE